MALASGSVALCSSRQPPGSVARRSNRVMLLTCFPLHALAWLPASCLRFHHLWPQRAANPTLVHPGAAAALAQHRHHLLIVIPGRCPLLQLLP